VSKKVDEATGTVEPLKEKNHRSKIAAMWLSYDKKIHRKTR